MATSAQQATFAAQQGKNWADPSDPNFGAPGYIGQNEYSQYQKQYPTDPASGVPGYGSSTAPSSGPTAPGQITTAQQVTSGSTPVGQTSAPGTPQTVAGSFQQGLVNWLNPQPVTASSPSVAPAIQANQYAQQRGLEQQRADLAAQSAANGTDMSGGFDTTLAGLVQNAANQQGQYAGGLINQQSELGQMEQGNALNLAGALLSGQQGLGQQMTLAQMQAELQREALAQQGQLGSESLSNQMTLGQGQLNEGLLGLLLNNQQFGQNLGAQLGMFGQGLDTQTLLSLINGFG